MAGLTALLVRFMRRGAAWGRLRALAERPKSVLLTRLLSHFALAPAGSLHGENLL